MAHFKSFKLFYGLHLSRNSISILYNASGFFRIDPVTTIFKYLALNFCISDFIFCINPIKQRSFYLYSK